MNYVSVCSGIEAATVAWHPLGWRPSLFAEIEKFPSAVLAHHYPEVSNVGDFTKIEKGQCESPNLIVGGTPCQDFSVAGLRAGMDGKRGQLTIEYARLAERLRPRWLVWENVPGVLSIDGGRAFGTFLGLLGQLGYGFAYRILDAQYLGVPQRRRRVFVVGYLGDWRRAAAVLFERHSLSGHPAPSREARQVSPCIPSRSLGGGGLGTDFDCDGGLVVGGEGNDLAHPLTCHYVKGGDPTTDNYILTGGFPSSDITHSLRADGFDASEDGTGQRGEVRERQVHGSLNGSKSGKQFDGVMSNMAVRRLAPRECERLQGFPDDYTRISDKTADGPRYKALGNSMAVPVMRWIGERIAKVDALP